MLLLELLEWWNGQQSAKDHQSSSSPLPPVATRSSKYQWRHIDIFIQMASQGWLFGRDGTFCRVSWTNTSNSWCHNGTYTTICRTHTSTSIADTRIRTTTGKSEHDILLALAICRVVVRCWCRHIPAKSCCLMCPRYLLCCSVKQYGVVERQSERCEPKTLRFCEWSTGGMKQPRPWFEINEKRRELEIHGHQESIWN